MTSFVWPGDADYDALANLFRETSATQVNRARDPDGWGAVEDRADEASTAFLRQHEAFCLHCGSDKAINEVLFEHDAPGAVPLLEKERNAATNRCRVPLFLRSGGCRSLAGCLWRRKCAELLEYVEIIQLAPIFDDLPSRKAENGNPHSIYLVAGCGDRDWPREIPGLCPAQRPAGHHLLAFGYEVFDRNAKASEGVAHLGHPAFQVCLRVSRGLDGITVDVAGSAELLKTSKISLIPHLLKDTASIYFVVFD